MARRWTFNCKVLGSMPSIVESLKRTYLVLMFNIVLAALKFVLFKKQQNSNIVKGMFQVLRFCVNYYNLNKSVESWIFIGLFL